MATKEIFWYKFFGNEEGKGSRTYVQIFKDIFQKAQELVIPRTKNQERKTKDLHG